MILRLDGGPHDGTTVTVVGNPPSALLYPAAGAAGEIEEHVYARRLRGHLSDGGVWEHYVYQGVRPTTSPPRAANTPLVRCSACGWHSHWPENPREHEMDCPKGRELDRA